MTTKVTVTVFDRQTKVAAAPFLLSLFFSSSVAALVNID
jgi:hypothetical protein